MRLINIRKIIAILILSFSLSPLKVSANVVNECNLMDIELIDPMLNLTTFIANNMKDKNPSKAKKLLLKTSLASLKKLEVLSNFPCEKVSEMNWPMISVERESAIQNEILRAQTILAQWKNQEPQKIICYKSGITKTITGKSAKCPKGFQIL